MFFPAEAETSFNNLFWSSIYYQPECFHPFQYITNQTSVGCLFKGDAAYWLKCFSVITKFHGDK